MKDKLVILGLVVALGLGVYTVVKPSQDNIDAVVEEKVAQVFAGVQQFTPVSEINLGGLRLVGQKKDLATATSTVCAIQSPAATSTLINAGVKFTLASTSAVTVDLAKGNTQYATTTSIGSAYVVGASATATIVASSTGSVAGDATIFGPSKWFVVKYGGPASGAGNASTGNCWAVFATP